MSDTRKANVPEATYFVTLTVDSWVDVFTRKELVDELLKNIRYCQDNKGLELFAYVIMSNQMHFVMRRTEGLLPPHSLACPQRMQPLGFLPSGSLSRASGPSRSVVITS